MYFGFYEELEILSWRKALKVVSKYLGKVNIFLNCNPYFIEESRFPAIKELFAENNIPINKAYLEITERSAINDFSVFYEQLSHFREKGFKFAVDDVGGGYASLESIVYAKPEVVKIDRHIIKDISTDGCKRSIVKFIVSFCKENNIISIAEGIETKEDLELVKSIGVDAGQGYYLYKPTSEIDLQKMSGAITYQ